MNKIFLYSRHTKDRIFRDVAIVTSGNSVIEGCVFINCDTTNYIGEGTLLKNCLGIGTEIAEFARAIAQDKKEAEDNAVANVCAFILNTYSQELSEEMYINISDIMKRHAGSDK